jgi:nucleotide-binding universal stress UspA family protein
VASRFASHITSLYVRIDSFQLILNATDGFGLAAGAAPISQQVRQDLLEADDARARGARKNFDAFCEQHHLPITEAPSASIGVSASWREVAGDPRDETTKIGRFNDLIVLARPQMRGDLFIDDIGSILMSCGRPLLIAASPLAKTIGSTIAIAWKQTAEAARAVTAALPLLEKADKIVVLSSYEERGKGTATRGSGENLAEQLRWRGLPTSVRAIEEEEQPRAQAIIGAALEANADLLVMGAYGHSRARELVFGGVTRQVLNDAQIPVLLSH